ncbi:MAG: guanylate kinase [Bacteroidales bacterium]
MNSGENNRGKVLIFSAPSGAGKSTVVRHLMSKYIFLGFSVSATSRAPRGDEKHGKEYFFYSAGEFRKMIEQDLLVEYEEVYAGFYYGTLKSEVLRIFDEGKIAVFDIDVKGGITLKKLYGKSALSVFIMPPSIEALRERLVSRGTETEESVIRRVAKAREEMSYSASFDKIVINDNLERCLEEAESIVEQFFNS